MANMKNFTNPFNSQQTDVIRRLYPDKKYSLYDIAKKMGVPDPGDTTVQKNVSNVALHVLHLTPRRRHTATRYHMEELEKELEALRAQVATLTKAGRPVWHGEMDGLWYGDLLVAVVDDKNYTPVIDRLAELLNEEAVDLAKYMLPGAG